MKGTPEYKDRKLSLVGKIMYEIQNDVPTVEMSYDSWLTKYEPSITPSMVSKVRYGLQVPSPLFIQTVIKAYDLNDALAKRLIKAMHEMLKNVRKLRIYSKVVMKNLKASIFLANILKPKSSIIGKMKAFCVKWIENMKHVLTVFSNVLSNSEGYYYANKPSFIHVPVNAF